MNAYLIQLDLTMLSERLSRCFKCQLGPAETRDILRDAGFIESPYGWLTHDPRLLMLALLQPGGTLF